MKGSIKALKRTPHLFTSKVGLSNKSSDPQTDELVRRFAGLETYSEKLVKDSVAFRDAVNIMLTSSADFASAFKTIFNPIGSESGYEFERKFPQAMTTMQNIGFYQTAMIELKESLRPELELIDSRIIAPATEYQSLVKKIRKTITKREHKLIDFDRHNNSYTKLRDKKEKSLSDEKNLYKVEADYQQAESEYSHFNDLLQTELPRFFEMSTQFITPLFQSFYFMQLNIFYITLEKIQGFASDTYSTSGDIQSNYLSKVGDAPDQMAELVITKRGALSSARFTPSPSIRRTPSDTSSASRIRAPSAAVGASRPPPSRTGSNTATSAAAPPPYSPSAAAVAANPLAGKRPPPPIPSKPKPKAYVTALYDFTAQSDGDLSFVTGDKIEVLEKSGDWWKGTLNGQTGVFPANYIQE